MKKITLKYLQEMMWQCKRLERKRWQPEWPTKKGYRDLVMSTEDISLNIVENATSDKLSKGDLRKAWGRLER